jgi:YidC/Oxa1 family membrane protein insertase
MERRALLAIVLSVAILLAWQALFSPPAAPPPPDGREAAEAPAPPAPPTPAPGPPPPEVVPAPSGPTAPEGPGPEVVTPLYRVSFDATGGVTAWELSYRGTKRLVVGGPVKPLAVAIGRPGQPPELVSMRAQVERLAIGPEQPAGELVFSGRTADGLQVEKRLRVRADSYRIETELRIQGAAPAGLSVLLYWTSPVAVPGATPEAPWHTFGEGTDRRQLLGRIIVAGDGKPEVFDPPAPALRDPKEPGPPGLKDPHVVPVRVVGDRRWVVLENDYFIAALIPSGGAQVLLGRGPEQAQAGLAFTDVAPERGRAWEGRGRLYVGPKEWNRLTALGVGLEQAQARNYGCFPLPCDYGGPLPMQWVCVPLLWLMNFFAARLPGQNYGVAIILLTVLVKIAFYPLTQKSMSSMKQMQALQPQLNALRSKYKSDPQRFQREQLELFRKHKVNPMGGCLPMVVQIPIFYALYLTLQYSVELQGAHFIPFWIEDLSKKDPYYVLPILMGISMLVQQKMTPTVGDPRQARIMLIMPVIFTFMFLEFPTGLVLYWLVNNLLSIGQQYLIDRTAARRAAAPPVVGKPDKEARKA